jgi:hypothetical protein
MLPTLAMSEKETRTELLKRPDRLESSLAIQQLPSLYAMALDVRDLDALAKLYADDEIPFKEWTILIERGPAGLCQSHV